MGAWVLLILVFNLNGQYEVQHWDFKTKTECQDTEKVLEALKPPTHAKYHHLVAACFHGQSEEEFDNNLQAILNLPKDK